MAKPTGGLLAFSARGSIAKTIVYASWRGRQYVRQHVIPANPRTNAQTFVRSAFSYLSALWKTLPLDITSNWTLAAKGLPVTDRNLFVKANLPTLNGSGNLVGLLLNNGAKGGLTPDSVAVSATAGGLDVTVVAPGLPTGWSITQAIVAVFLASSPQTLPVLPIFTGTDTTDPYIVSITGLTTGLSYDVQAWFQFVKPDGTPAYGSSIITSGIPV